MNSIICPISNEQINENSARITALITLMFSLAFILTQHLFFPVVLMIDFYMRSFTGFSIFNRIAHAFINTLNIPSVWIDKAPKIFAARIGLFFAAAAVVLAFLNITASIVVISILTLFAFLEAALNICAGCYIYSLIILPLYKNKKGLS